MSTAKTAKATFQLIVFVIFSAQLFTTVLSQNTSLPNNTLNGVRAIYLSGELYVALNDASQFIGAQTTLSGKSLYIQTAKGILKLTDDSPDVVWQENNQERRRLALARPVYKRFDAWYAPDELLAILGINERNSQLFAANKSTNLLIQTISNTFGGSWEILQFDANRSSALSFYRVNERGEAQQNLFLMDIDSLKSIFPEQRNHYERFSRNIKEKNVLYFALSSLEASSWQAEFNFQQGSKSFKASYPTEVSLLSGDNQDVSPETPVTGVILLPDEFDLSQDMSISWSNINSVYNF